jgi:dTDP-4-dehydrorhamnose reductase
VDSSLRSSPTYVGHLAESVLALVRRPAYGVFHRTGLGACSELHLARTALRLAGSKATAVALAHDDPPAEGVREIVLGSRRTEIPSLPDWRLGVREYLDARNHSPGAGNLRLLRPPQDPLV